MKPTYAPDNTRSSMFVILLLAAGVTIGAVLLGLSEKPEVSAIGVSVAATDGDTAGLLASAPIGAAAPADSTTATGAGAATIELDETGRPILQDEADTATTAGTDSAARNAISEGASDPSAEAVAGPGTAADDTTTTATPIPIPTPEPTAEVAPAVEPTSDPLAATESVEDDLGVAAVSPGVITGQFFTRPDEDEGATVTRNELTLILAEDGTGSFTGVLQMTLFDQTLVELAMDGPIRWSNETPQVTAELVGSYVRDSPIDADDVQAGDAELTISSLGSGSGSLCTETCFGFTFPPQSGL